MSFAKTLGGLGCVVMLTGCAAQATDTKTVEVQATQSSSTEALYEELPLSKYFHGNEYTALFNQAVSALANKCMIEHGERAVFDSSTPDLPAVNHLSAIGVVSRSDSGAYTALSDQSQPWDPKKDPTEYRNWGLSDAEVATIEGSNSKPGCLDSAASTVSSKARAAAGHSSLGVDVDALSSAFDEAASEAIRSPKVVSASKRWVYCVQSQGFRASNPGFGIEGRLDSSADESLRAQDTSRAIGVDLTCKNKSRLKVEYVNALHLAQSSIVARKGHVLDQAFAAEKKHMSVFAELSRS